MNPKFNECCADLAIAEQVIKTIEADAVACEREGRQLELKQDKLNAYLMATQAMAHRLDIQRIKAAFKIP
jgi:hypothetical protein